MCRWIKILILAVSILAVLILIAFYTLKAKTECYDDSCVIKACAMRSVMDKKSIACKNFKKFSCGESITSRFSIFDEFDQNLKLYEEQVFNSSIQDYDDSFLSKVKTFNTKCKEDEPNFYSLVKFKEVIYLTGPFPELFDQDYFKSFIFPIEDYEFQSKKKGFTAQSLFSTYLARDRKHPVETSIYIGLPTHTFIDPKSVLKAIHNDALKDKYMKYILFSLEDHVLVQPLKEKLSKKVLSAILDLEVRLGKILENQSTRRRTILSTSLFKLSKRFPYFGWEYYFKQMYPKVDLHTKTIVVTHKNYLYDIEKLFENKYILNLYMIYRNINEMRPFLHLTSHGRTFVDLYASFGATYYTNRIKFCKDLIYRYFGPGLTSLIIERFSIKYGGQETIRNMIQNIKDSFHESIHKSSWIDKKTKHDTIRRLNRMKYSISVSDTQFESLSDPFDRQVYYIGVCVHKPILFTIIGLNKFSNYKNNELFGRNISAFDEVVGPHFHGILYDQNENVLIIPVGVLQSLAFDLYWPPYLYYGGIGTIMSRVLIQGFNSTLYQNSEEKQSKIWWAKYTKDNCDAKHSQCLDYSGLFAKNEEGNSYMNYVLQEIEGLKLAYRAYMLSKPKYFFDDPKVLGFDQYTNEQMFFISYGNCFCLSRPKMSFISSTSEPIKTPLDIVHKLKFFKDAFGCEKRS